MSYIGVKTRRSLAHISEISGVFAEGKAMRTVIFCLALFAHLPVWAQTLQDTYINHAWVDGVYWNQSALPGWGFFVDVQEETLFGAIYGYTANGSPTFITLQGNLISSDPMRYRGDVFSVTNGGSAASDVGSFTWEAGIFEASPAATLDISSNILNRSNLSLVRFSYVEDDKVDMFTAGNWDIITRILSVSFGESYGISDERYVDDGITYAVVFDNSQPDNMGIVGYFPPARGDVFAMLVEFDTNTNEFYVFYASDTEMFGRSWLLDDGEDPTGNGYYFHASADTFQLSYQDQPRIQESKSGDLTEKTSLAAINSSLDRDLRRELASKADAELQAMLPAETVQSIYSSLAGIVESRAENLAAE